MTKTTAPWAEKRALRRRTELGSVIATNRPMCSTNRSFVAVLARLADGGQRLRFSGWAPAQGAADEMPDGVDPALHRKHAIGVPQTLAQGQQRIPRGIEALLVVSGMCVGRSALALIVWKSPASLPSVRIWRRGSHRRRLGHGPDAAEDGQREFVQQGRWNHVLGRVRAHRLHSACRIGVCPYGPPIVFRPQSGRGGPRMRRAGAQCTTPL